MNMADLDDDLQSFIADCEWKTRKILRDSNKRRQVSPTIPIWLLCLTFWVLCTNKGYLPISSCIVKPRTMLAHLLPKNAWRNSSLVEARAYQHLVSVQYQRVEQLHLPISQRVLINRHLRQPKRYHRWKIGRTVKRLFMMLLRLSNHFQ